MNKQILKYMSTNLKDELTKLDFSEDVCEIRLRTGKPINIVYTLKDIFLEYTVSSFDIEEILLNISDNSIYSIQNEINNGYITIEGGHRIGISGSAVFLDGNIKNIKNISSMNIRVARQIKNCSEKILEKIYENNCFLNTLIISPPGAGKTTILRDLILNISNGNRYDMYIGNNVSLVDERNEIACTLKGINQLDVGKRTDVMSNIKKSLGIEMMLRSMGPNIIAIDEVGKDEMKCIDYAINSGCKLLFTMHGKDISDILSKDYIKELLLSDKSIIKRIVILSKKNGPGTIEKIYFTDQNYINDKEKTNDSIKYKEMRLVC